MRWSERLNKTKKSKMCYDIGIKHERNEDTMKTLKDIILNDLEVTVSEVAEVSPVILSRSYGLKPTGTFDEDSGEQLLELQEETYEFKLN